MQILYCIYVFYRGYDVILCTVYQRRYITSPLLIRIIPFNRNKIFTKKMLYCSSNHEIKKAYIDLTHRRFSNSKWTRTVDCWLKVCTVCRWFSHTVYRVTVPCRHHTHVFALFLVVGRARMLRRCLFYTNVWLPLPYI